MEQLSLTSLVEGVGKCQLCANELAHGVNPVVQINEKARILIAGQAPGLAVHKSGIPFDDKSGDRLREWLGVDKDIFYDSRQVAILPMGFCYPGKGKSGDLPPMTICAQTWRQPLLHHLTDLKLTLLIGKYAQDYHLANSKQSLTETVKHWRDLPSGIMALPHPSPRNNIWLAKNPWFAEDLLPELKVIVQAALNH
ncbi:uracil-DNA glycosylase family protein [Shewanella donghaensis]|uniref:uracil-DNA glycosylase family protein n=1 Tax=Shewanella donghaensis TaxID=238836 RepID=UPI001182E7E0|nr:uracil-DNA glycosylase family protein [Shewanella donghaensis]